MGLRGDDIFLRLSDDDRRELMKSEGVRDFELMKGRPMKGYTLIPRSRKAQPETIRRWVSRSLEWAGEMPTKKAKR